MSKYIPFPLVILILCLSMQVSVMAKESKDNIVTVNDLVSDGTGYDGKTVSFNAEAIGEPMNRGSYSWINVSDGTNAIGLWLTTEDATKIKTYGNYQQQGDLIEITGTFHNACSEHGGEADLHVDTINVLQSGYYTEHPVSPGEVAAALIIGGLALFTMVHAVKTLLQNKH